MKSLLALILSLASYGSLCVAATLDEMKQTAKVVASSGAAAAGFAAVAKGKVDSIEVASRFAEFGEDAVTAAKLWAQDDELLDAPPAFRRFLYFEYLTKGTDITAAASNPEDLLINMDSSVKNIFSDLKVADTAKMHMQVQITEPKFEVIGDVLLATFPMVPPAEKAATCIACHASKEVNRPYPPGATVLGYTFVVQPL